MERSLRQVDQLSICDTISNPGNIEQGNYPGTLEIILEALKLTEIRVRKLTMVVTIWLCIAMNMYTEESLTM